MRITPTNAETKLQSNDFIVSKTDSKGKITYCNEIFMSIAGYKEQELMGKNHNIIRHPDMPKVAFKLAWELIQNGKEFFGFVKNMKKMVVFIGYLPILRLIMMKINLLLDTPLFDVNPMKMLFKPLFLFMKNYLNLKLIQE